MPDAEYATGSAQYRRTGGIPRQRVAYIQAGDGEAQLRAVAPGDDPDRYAAAHEWSASRPNIYETDWSTHRHRRGRRGRRGRTAAALMVMTAVAAAVGGIIVVSGADQPAEVPVAVDAALVPKSTVATRAARVPPAAIAPSGSSPARTPSPKASSLRRPPRPVTGLNQAQMNNAAVIVQVGQERGLPRRAMLVAMMTGLQESSLRNLANPTVPASLDQPNEGSGENFDSLGVFQQRPSQGWGTVAQLMTPRYAADAFYERLLKVSDWESKSLGEAAQAVQRSAVPDAYAVHEDRAAKVLDALASASG